MVETDVLALPEIVDRDVTGLLVPPGDAPALAHAIDRLATDPELCRRVGATGRRRLERDFTVDRMVRETIAIYDDLR